MGDGAKFDPRKINGAIMNNKLLIFNSLTRTIEPFEPLQSGQVGLYACGPTVYNYAHIGNLRTYFFEDILRRVLQAIGLEVRHVMNVTDVGHLQSDADSGDDKMNLASGREQKSPWEIAKFYEKAFFHHMDLLGNLRPSVVCRATDHIAEMIEFIESLLADGYAYESGGNVYFEVARFSRYCDFARLKMDEQCQTERVALDSRKRNQADFALWFSQSKYPNQIMLWDSPWGQGFPGWHIECSAMATAYLGERFDIHCGGIDHVPVHHTNEIAQSEARFGQGWVRYWVHGEFLVDDTGKMSKSSGDFLHLDRLIAEGYEPMDYRYLMLTAHYRNRLHFSWDSLNQARRTRRTLGNLVRDWREGMRDDPVAASIRWEKITERQTRLFAPLLQDLHTPQALAELWIMIRDDALTPAEKLTLLARMEPFLGLEFSAEICLVLTPEQEHLIAKRLDARAARDFITADAIRDQLAATGIGLKDHVNGTDFHRLYE